MDKKKTKVIRRNIGICMTILMLCLMAEAENKRVVTAKEKIHAANAKGKEILAFCSNGEGLSVHYSGDSDLPEDVLKVKSDLLFTFFLPSKYGHKKYIRNI